MLNEELKIRIGEALNNPVYEESGDWLNVTLEGGQWKEFARKLRTDQDLNFDFLFCVTCVDWKTHLTMVYHFRSTSHLHHLVVKLKLDRNSPVADSVSDIWRTAEFNEREAYEMFGVEFTGHPDLRLLILPDGWEGKNPMRKDFEDPVNMVRL